MMKDGDGDGDGEMVAWTGIYRAHWTGKYSASLKKESLFFDSIHFSAKPSNIRSDYKANSPM